jgi:5'-phosphate synthase pdxT subunit
MREHAHVLADLGAEVSLVRRASELSEVDGLVIPGGESSVIDKLSRTFGLQRPLRAAIAEGLPVYGTCAGMILLADRIVDGITGQESFGGIDITVQRNAFGPQTESFETDLDVTGMTGGPVRAVFIRAPLVSEVGSAATPIAALDDGRVVAVEQDALLATAFHPEVSGETRFHRRFLATVAARS